MRALIDLNFFQGSLHLPYVNLQSASTASSGKAIDIHQQQLERQIAIHQKDYLKRFFGKDLTDEEFDNLPENIQSLIVDMNLNISPIANYVYCRILPDYASKSTNAGEKTKKSENSTDTSYQAKLILAWNRMVEMNGEIREAMYTEGLEDTYTTDYTDPIYKLQYGL